MITTTPFNFLRTVSSILKVYGQSTMSTSPREEREHSAQSVIDSECDLGGKGGQSGEVEHRERARGRLSELDCLETISAWMLSTDVKSRLAFKPSSVASMEVVLT